MGSYQVALDSPGRPADIVATRVYRYKTGYGVNAEQELAKMSALSPAWAGVTARMKPGCLPTSTGLRRLA